jgi:hypothetical protein
LLFARKKVCFLKEVFMKTANTELAFHSLMAVIFATFFWGCKDEHPQLFIDQKTKDYVVYQQGS